MKELIKKVNEFEIYSKSRKRKKIYFLPDEDINRVQKRICKLFLIEEYKNRMEKICIPN